jgi:hypothetical protein
MSFAVSATHRASWTLTATGHGPELAAALDGNERPGIPWVRAGIAFASGDPVAAAEICAEIGAATEEASARLAAARMLAAQGRRAEADTQLQRAIAFYRSVGASRYVREGELLLSASA